MGQVIAGGSSRPITAEEMRSVAAMQQAMTRIPVPTLQHRDNPHEYLFFAMSDGSGQDLHDPRLGPPTNVGHLALQAEAAAADPDNRVGYHYTRGIGAQSNGAARLFDGALATTWADGIERIDADLAEPAPDSKREGPR
jgi:hypothetical protein